MRRIASLWLPRWPTDRLERLERRRSGRPGPERPEPTPLALVAAMQGTHRVVAVNAAAAAEGVMPGVGLADARALHPALGARLADPAADAEGLGRLAAWCGRYSPWTAPDGGDGVRLDVSGCGHLFGGEATLLADLVGRLRGFGIEARAAVADSLGAAWALARFGALETMVLPPGGAREALADLPTVALRLPATTVEGLRRLGLRRIGDLCGLPRAALAARFGREVGERLDQALGRAAEPLSPAREAPRFWSRLAWPEPIAERADILRGAGHLLADLCRQLARAEQGARRLDCALYLVDGAVRRVAVGLSRPARDPTHLLRLLGERLDGLEAGFGADAMTLAAPAAEPLTAAQLALHPAAAGAGRPARLPAADPELGLLVDRLGNRLGPASIARFAPYDSHLPERAVRMVAPLAPPAGRGWREAASRPVRLLSRPEPVEVMAEVPDGPPLLFRWRGRAHRVRAADGPERLAPEWWRDPRSAAAATRDYYRVEDLSGRRFWLYRDGLYHRPALVLPIAVGGDGPPPTDHSSRLAGGERSGPDEGSSPRWYLHGLFG